MNEEIKKNELRDDELENVSGGYGEANAPHCEKCGAKMEATLAGAAYYYECRKCNIFIPIPG